MCSARYQTWKRQWNKCRLGTLRHFCQMHLSNLSRKLHKQKGRAGRASSPIPLPNKWTFRRNFCYGKTGCTRSKKWKHSRHQNCWFNVNKRPSRKPESPHPEANWFNLTCVSGGVWILINMRTVIHTWPCLWMHPPPQVEYTGKD